MTSEEYEKALESLFRRRRFGARPGLEPIRALLGGLADPQLRFSSIHVAGSKGKGSVSAMAESILRAAGRSTGLYTSPHLRSYRERIRVDGQPISEKDVSRELNRVLEVESQLLSERSLEQPATFFEVTTALAFDHFARAKIDSAVVEVGLGGRLDATNVLAAPVDVITTIELEHTDVLGPTLSHIAAEKAGILRAGASAVVGDLPDEAWTVVRRRTQELGLRVLRLSSELRVSARELFEGGQRFTVDLPGHHFEALELPLEGGFQTRNAAVAVAAALRFADANSFPLPESAIRRGLATVVWPGRLQRIGRNPDVYLDVAHTEESARALAHSLGEILPMTDPVGNAIVFGCLVGKRVEAILPVLAPLARTIVLVPIRSDRGLSPLDLRRMAQGIFPRVVVADSVRRGLAIARAATEADGLLLITGSDYLAGEVLDEIESKPRGEPDLSDPSSKPESARAASRPRAGPRSRA
ncbi:MAG: folylpolyglutamate synthase/dihydrofolate synthase family protein [Thermoplasmata archaeon]